MSNFFSKLYEGLKTLFTLGKKVVDDNPTLKEEVKKVVEEEIVKKAKKLFR